MSYKKRLLLIEDEKEMISLLETQAHAEGFRIQVEQSATSGYKVIEREKPDLILIDTTLPDLHGLDLCRKIKNSVSLRSLPIILMGKETTEIDIILGLELGADDYILKPFSPSVVFARIKAVLRRSNSSEKTSPVVAFGPFVLEIDRHLLFKENQVVPLTLSELGILRKLLTYKGKSISRLDLLQEFNSQAPFVADRNIDVHIASLRKKLGKEYSYIKTVRGFGYQFCDGSLKASKRRRLTTFKS